MRTLISEVLLPASAAVGLLAMLTIPPATAEDRALPQDDGLDVSHVSAAGFGPAGHTVEVRDGPLGTSNPTIEPRCERIERIGKFAITRCQ